MVLISDKYCRQGRTTLRIKDSRYRALVLAGMSAAGQIRFPDWRKRKQTIPWTRSLRDEQQGFSRGGVMRNSGGENECLCKALAFQWIVM
jgi:hypothetical protein